MIFPARRQALRIPSPCRKLSIFISRVQKIWRKSASPGFVAQASSVDQSVPPALYAGPEHLIVKIDAAVAQRLIEVVQHALPAGIRQVQFGVDDFLFSFARRAREREPCMADDQAAS